MGIRHRAQDRQHVLAHREALAILTLVVQPVQRFSLSDSAPIPQPYQALRPDSSVVERGPEKAGVGGSIPSLATTATPQQILRGT